MVDDLLTPKAYTPPDASGVAFAAIAGRIRRRTIVRRTATAAGVAFAFAAGWLVAPAGQTVVETTVRRPAEASVLVAAELTAGQMEMNAELADDPATSALWYRRAGDDYLERANYAEAERCYRLHVRTGKITTVHGSESWLLKTVIQATPKGTDS
jgi:hypothetical protein